MVTDENLIELFEEARTVAEELTDDFVHYSVSYTTEIDDTIFGDNARFAVEMSQEGSALARVKVAPQLVRDKYEATGLNYLESLLYVFADAFTDDEEADED